ncbi:Putative ribonuclease H protein At1g65750 [Linum perenne]
MFFADDLVLFGYANISQAVCINEVLDRFSSISGQEISREKSKIFFSRNVDRRVSQQVCNVLKINPTQNLEKYLGVPLIHGRNSKQLYQYLIERIDKKLAGWKLKSLSTAGRVTMAISVLNSLPTYVMQTTLLPVEVCSTIDKKIRDFIWGSSNGERKMHLVNWETVCTPKRQGGLGLRSARELNHAYLMKLVWGLIKRPSKLWADLLISKYMKRTAAGLIPRKSTRRSSCWKGISENWELFRGGLRWSIRNGRKTNFWRERWLDSGVIIGEHINPPAGHEHGAVADYCNVKGEWDIQKLQHILTPHMLKEVVGMTPPLAGLGNDNPVWGFEPDGKYTVRTGYRLAKDITEDGGDDIWQIAWKWELPQRVRQFLWIALHGRLLTNAERVRRHLTGTGSCSFCYSAPETDEHLLRTCQFARQVWIKLFTTSGSTHFFTTPLRDWWKSNITFKHLTERNWRVNIKHIYREANHLADCLANKGHALELGTHSVNRSEANVLYWSSYDVVGSAEPRRVVM